MKKKNYQDPKSEIITEVLYDVMICTSPGPGENEGTEDDPLD